MSYDPRYPHWQQQYQPQPPPLPEPTPPPLPQPPFQNYSPKYVRRPPKDNTLWYVLGGCGFLGMLAVVLCCGAIASAPRSAKSGPLGFLASQAQLNQLKDHPDVRTHIGQIKNLSLNLAESSAANQGRIGKKAAVYDISGTKGKGFIVGPIDEGWGKERRFITAILVISDDQSYVIVRP